MVKLSIRLYSTPNCPWCHEIKKYLAEKGVNYENIDISINTKAVAELFEKSGQMGVPVLDINGIIIIGFNEEAINQAFRVLDVNK